MNRKIQKQHKIQHFSEHVEGCDVEKRMTIDRERQDHDCLLRENSVEHLCVPPAPADDDVPEQV